MSPSVAVRRSPSIVGERRPSPAVHEAGSIGRSACRLRQAAVRGAGAFALVRLLLVIAAALYVAAPRAAAQGTSGQVPDPISSQELTKYLDRYVRPTPAQWEAIEKFHEAYKTEFAALREGEIESFLQEAKKLQGVMPQRKQMEEYLKNLRRLHSRVKSLDNRLFDQIQGVLEDPQAAAMPRVRLARERQTYSSPGLAGAFGTIAVDITEVLDTLELTAAQRAALDPVLVPYEAQLTRKLEESVESAVTMMVDMFDALEAQGFGDIDEQELMSNPDRMRELMEAVQQIMAQTGKKGRELAYDLAQANHRTRRALIPLLPEETVSKFRAEFVRRGYPTLAGTEGRAGRVLKAALRLKGLSDEQRQSLQAVQAAFNADDARLEDEFMTAMDEAARDTTLFDQMGGLGRDGRRQEREERSRRRRELGEAAVAQAKAIVGPDLAAKLDKIDSPEHDADAFLPDPAAAQAADATAGGGGAPAASPRSFSGDMFLPAQIGPREVAVWSGRLQLDAGGRAVLESLHGDYLQHWANNVQPHIDAVMEAQRKAFVPQEPGSATPPVATEADIDAIYVARSAALAAIEQTDAAFLNDVRSALTTDATQGAMELIALERAMEAGTRTVGWAGFEENREGKLNLVQLVNSAFADSPEAAAAAQEVLMAHASELRNGAREVHAATLDNQRAMEKLGARISQVQSSADGPGDMAAAMLEYQQAIKPHAERLATATTRQRALVRQIFDELTSSLAPEQAAALRKAYNREAFPQVFEDPRSAEDLLKKSVELPDLTDAQRESLQEVAAEFAAAYDAVSERMVEITRQSRNIMMGSDPEEWRAWQDRRNELEKLRFERDEASTKAVRRIKGILTEEQAQRIPGLAKHGQEDDSRGPFR